MFDFMVCNGNVIATLLVRSQFFLMGVIRWHHLHHAAYMLILVGDFTYAGDEKGRN